MKFDIINRPACFLFTAAFVCFQLNAQQPLEKNDVTTPLHAMKVNYPVPYEAPAKEKVKAVVYRVS